MRLIDADKLDYYTIHDPDDDDAYILFITDMDIENAPTIDAVEVVRCKDCKYYLNNHLCKVFSKHYGTIETNESDYCSYGQRRGE